MSTYCTLQTPVISIHVSDLELEPPRCGNNIRPQKCSTYKSWTIQKIFDGDADLIDLLQKPFFCVSGRIPNLVNAYRYVFK